MTRAVIDLEAHATVLDAAERLATAPRDGDVALVVPSGAPVLRGAVFFEALRALAGDRRLSVVTADARARSVAASVHLPAYASLAALERHELDPTERMGPLPRPGAARSRTRPGAGGLPRRTLGVVASLGGAALVLLGVVLPEATVVVAAAAQPLGPVDLVVKAGSGGEVALNTLTGAVTGTVRATATGSRTEDVRAKGAVQLQNKTTDDARVPKASVFRTSDGIQFLSTADATVPRSVIIPGTPFSLVVGKATVAVEAAVAGTTGNVAAGRITVAPSPDKYTVTNPEPTTGGQVRKIPVVKLDDYDAAVRRAPDALRAAAEDQLARWVREPRAGQQVVPQVLARQTSLAPASVDVVGKEVEGFELTVNGIATAYAVPDTEPRRAAVVKLRDAAAVGNDVDDRSATVDVKSVRIGDDGVTWALTAKGWQTHRTDRLRVGRLLAGRAVGDVRPVLDAEGLRLVRIDAAPAWWPIMPILDGRITVQVEAPPVSGIRGREGERGSGSAGPSESPGAERPSAAGRPPTGAPAPGADGY